MPFLLVRFLWASKENEQDDEEKINYILQKKIIRLDFFGSFLCQDKNEQT